jgi:hypothetical protein
MPPSRDRIRERSLAQRARGTPIVMDLLPQSWHSPLGRKPFLAYNPHENLRTEKEGCTYGACPFQPL